MSEVLGDRERGLSNFFKIRAAECAMVAENFRGESEDIPGTTEAAIATLEKAAASMTEMAEKLNGFAFSVDQQEGTRVSILKDAEEGRTLSACVRAFKALIQDECFPAELCRHMMEHFELLNKEYTFEP